MGTFDPLKKEAERARLFSKGLENHEYELRKTDLLFQGRPKGREERWRTDDSEETEVKPFPAKRGENVLVQGRKKRRRKSREAEEWSSQVLVGGRSSEIIDRKKGGTPSLMTLEVTRRFLYY